jgi:hypothetical protein
MIKMQIMKLLVMVTLLVVLGSVNVAKGFAQEADTEGNDVSWTQLGFSERTLRAPLDTERFTFNLPANWTVQDGAVLALHFTANTGLLTSGQAVLTVELNGILLNTLVMERAGEQTVAIPVPPEAWAASTSSNNRHTLAIDFDSNTGCESNIFAEVVIHDDSRFTLPHMLGALSTDLTQLPYPLFHRSFVTNDTLAVIPDAPTTEELRAAMAVIVGWGQMTDSSALLTLTPASELTAETAVDKHIILVGKPDTLPQITEVLWPAPWQNGSFDLAANAENDGIIQMVVSPWDNTKIALLISGQNDTALVKAAQAFSLGQIQPYTRSDLAVISQLQKERLFPDEIATERTLADLGYQDTLLQGNGSHTASFDFHIPDGFVVAEDAYFDLVYAHSAFVNTEQSRVTILLNGEPISSIRLNDESVNVSRNRTMLPATGVRPGFNELELDIALTPLTECNLLDEDGTWFNIYPESTFNLPLQPAPEDVVVTYRLIDYPDPFALDFTLGRTAVVVPEDNISAWQTAAQIILDISRRTRLPLADPVVAYAHDVPEEVRQSRDLLLVGVPADLPLLAELEEALPIRFDTINNRLIAEDLPFVYRRPVNIPLGYLELFTAPWGIGRYILLVSGNSEEGVQMAATALADASKRIQMTANVAFVDGEQVAIVNGRLRHSPPEIATAPDASVAEEAPVTARPVFSNTRPTWVLPLMVTSLLAIVVLVIGVAVTSWRQRVRPK